MNTIKEISLWKGSFTSAGDTFELGGDGKAFYTPFIRGFSNKVRVRTTTNPQPEAYLTVPYVSNLQQTDGLNYQNMCIIVKGYVRPLDIGGGSNKHIGLPFTHVMIRTMHTESPYLWDIWAEEHTPNSAPGNSLFPIYGIEQCFGPVFNPADHPVGAGLDSNGVAGYQFSLKLLGDEAENDRNYKVSGIYYFI